MEDFDFLMFGGAEVIRNAEEDEFNERWNRLVEIQGQLIDTFLCPMLSISDQMVVLEILELKRCLRVMCSWYATIAKDLDNANQHHLSRYAASIAKAAITAIRLCAKYDVCDDIRYVDYVSRREMIVLNGGDLWFLG